MRSATKRLISILVSLGFLIGAIVLFSSLVLPAYRDVQQLRGEKKSLEAVVKEEEQLITTANRLLTEYQSAANLRDTLSLVLPREEALPGMINQIQGIAKSAGVTVENMNVENLPLEHSRTSSIVEPVGSFKVTIRVRGSYEALRSYVQSLETNVRIIDVDSFALSGGGAAGPLTADLVLRTYYQR
ncbi:MAG: type 4a pilus biogenesis protein PilO [bacterium]|nr:type 4a pilus biogenesis protein PilO [bacterium]